MKKYLLILLLNSLAFCYAQQTNDDVKIINSGKQISNEMIFRSQYGLKKSKKLLFFVNNKQVECIAYYNQEELKSIRVLQPKQAIKKYGNKGKNGAVLVQLKDQVQKPEIVITTNRLYYKCEIEGKLVDTTEMYYKEVDRKNCLTIDLRDTSEIQTLYIGFDNKIRVKNLGVGWDMATVAVMRGRMSGSNGNFIIRVDKEDTVKMVISTNWMKDKAQQKEIFFKAVKLPELKK